MKLIFTCLFLFGFTCFGQSLKDEIDIKVGKQKIYDSKEIKEGYNSNTFKYNDNDVFQSTKMDVDLVVGQHENRYEGFKEVNVLAKKRFYDSQILLKKGGEFYVLFGEASQDEKNYNFYYQKVDAKNFETTGKRTKFTQVKIDGNFKASDFFITVSKDYSKILVTCRFGNKIGSTNELLFTVYNADFDKIWRESQRFANYSMGELYKNILVDNHGNVYYLFSKYLGQVILDPKSGSSTRAYEFRGIVNNGTDYKKYINAVVIDYVISEAVLKVNENNDVFVLGSFSYIGDQLAKGAYIMKVNNKTKEIEYEVFNEFDSKIIIAGNKKYEKKTPKPEKLKRMEMSDFIVNNVFFRENGNLLFVAENNSAKQVGEGSTTTPWIKYLIVMEIDENGKTLWGDKIPINQIIKNYYYRFGSYGLAYVDNELYLIYNKGEVKFNGYDLCVTKFDKTGNRVDDVLINAQNETFKLIPKSSKQISSNEVIFMCEKSKLWKKSRTHSEGYLLKITFN